MRQLHKNLGAVRRKDRLQANILRNKALTRAYTIATLCNEGEEGDRMFMFIAQTLAGTGMLSAELTILLEAVHLLGPLLLGKKAHVTSPAEHTHRACWQHKKTQLAKHDVEIDVTTLPAHLIAISGLSNFLMVMTHCKDAQYATFTRILKLLQELQINKFTSPLLPPDTGDGVPPEGVDTNISNPVIEDLLKDERLRDQKPRYVVIEDEKEEAQLKKSLEHHNNVYVLSSTLGNTEVRDTLYTMVQRSGALAVDSPYGASTLVYQAIDWEQVRQLSARTRERLPKYLP